MKKILLPLLASLFLIPACGGGDSDDGLEAIADAIESQIENDAEAADFLIGKGACIADKAIAYGAEELEKNGITLETIGDDIETLPEGGQEIVINSTLDCLTPSDMAEGIMQGAAEEGEPISMDAALCYAENMSREEWRVIVSGEEDSEEAGAIFLGLIADCPQLLVEIFMDDMGIDRSAAECAVEALSGPLLASLASVGEGEEPDMEVLVELFEVFVGCGVDPEMMG